MAHTVGQARADCLTAAFRLPYGEIISFHVKWLRNESTGAVSGYCAAGGGRRSGRAGEGNAIAGSATPASRPRPAAGRRAAIRNRTKVLRRIGVLLAFGLAHCSALAGASNGTIDLARIHGRIQVVESFPDFRVKVVESFADLHVQVVDSFPDAPGKWIMVDSFPDHRIQFVESFPDFTIRYVSSFPGVQ